MGAAQINASKSQTATILIQPLLLPGSRQRTSQALAASESLPTRKRLGGFGRPVLEGLIKPFSHLGRDADIEST